MGRRGVWSFLGPTAGWAFVLVFTIFYAEGWTGFRPFLNLEALVLAWGGTALCLSIPYPFGEVLRAVFRTARGVPAGDEEEARRWGEILRHGADSALGMGGAATMLGMILMLASIEDVSAVPRRVALSLTGIFYGLLLSEAFFIPLSRRVRGPDLSLKLPPPGGGQRRLLVGLGSGGVSVLGLFVILYSLSARLTSDLMAATPRPVPSRHDRFHVSFPLFTLDCDHRREDIVRDVETERWRKWVKAEELGSADRAGRYKDGDELVLQTSPTGGHSCIVQRPAARREEPKRASKTSGAVPGRALRP